MTREELLASPRAPKLCIRCGRISVEYQTVEVNGGVLCYENPECAAQRGKWDERALGQPRAVSYAPRPGREET